MAKVFSLSQQACENVVAIFLWYQPKLPRGLQDEEGKFHNQYTYVLGNPLENHMVVFRLIQFSLLGIMMLGPKI